jgi:hypothetical protein
MDETKRVTSSTGNMIYYRVEPPAFLSLDATPFSLDSVDSVASVATVASVASIDSVDSVDAVDTP